MILKYSFLVKNDQNRSKREQLYFRGSIWKYIYLKKYTNKQNNRKVWMKGHGFYCILFIRLTFFQKNKFILYLLLTMQWML